MPLLVDEARAYRLIPFIRDWACNDARWQEIWVLFEAFSSICAALVTPSHWTMFAILCSLFTRARYEANDVSGMHAEQWLEPKPYPPTVINYISQLPMPRVECLNSTFDKAQLLFHDWLWEMSPLLEEEDRVTLRAMKAVILDFALLLRAATVSKRNRCMAPVDPINVEA